MLKRILARTMPLPKQPQTDKPEDADAMEANAFFMAAAAAMPPLQPPEAVNDDPMASVHEMVAYALAHAGYLR
ncbi:hypothetical protein FV242_32250 [Methylobacterium sp. WL64]|uniref:hypothetical protein n=1 Tax=Methylobacterium sp. WL64 TaxID=2603894 RepID=UPI0011C9D0CF|nr:hypothetical protein [Methylobacterium sp. WL64]TXM97177.1 hypothetical protein FV242_32250 [Methylobacterium sp. WL64]